MSAPKILDSSSPTPVFGWEPCFEFYLLEALRLNLGLSFGPDKGIEPYAGLRPGTVPKQL